MAKDTPEQALANQNVADAIRRGVIEINGERVIYRIGKGKPKEYDWKDPEEWVRARTLALLVVSKGYPPQNIVTEVVMPARVPDNIADIVVYEDSTLKSPYLVVENKAAGQSQKDRNQGVEQMFGNAVSIGAKIGLYDEWDEHTLFDVENFPSGERILNIKGNRDSLPENYGIAPQYTYVAGGVTDIKASTNGELESKIRKAHTIIWAGGKRDPLNAFDEWSKLLFAKVLDEKGTPTGQPRSFQVGTGETETLVANRIHRLFAQGIKDDPTIFEKSASLNLSDEKIRDVVLAIQDVSLLHTDVDTIGAAFENFFGGIFRGQLGQYFTMRPLARFAVAMLGIGPKDFVLDPTCGSGGFLLEALLQVWHSVDENFKGQPAEQLQTMKTDFAHKHVFGIEIHDILARICKINLLLHHDGHTNIEADRSCLDLDFTIPRLTMKSGSFTRIVGNPPFGDEVKEGDRDHLGTNTLDSFEVAAKRDNIASEQVIVERCVKLLEDGGRFSLVLPDGFFNNQGEGSNCPQVRAWLARHGLIEAIVSLPDHAFDRSGAQNKTSILFFRKFSKEEKTAFDTAFLVAKKKSGSDDEVPDATAIQDVYSSRMPFKQMRTFLAEAEQIGYTPTGTLGPHNHLYSGSAGGKLDASQVGTILGEWRTFLKDPAAYKGALAPDCLGVLFHELWSAHKSRRLDPKYHLFVRTQNAHTPQGWIRATLGSVMKRRTKVATPEATPDAIFKVMTLGQDGEIREREAGKGNNYPEWRGAFFADGSSTWFAAKTGDLVYSSIDLWKGCISVVPKQFDEALVTKEFPIFEITDSRLTPEFVQALLRTSYYQRAFRAITTGHSNRRRTQQEDFEALEICFPATTSEQVSLVRSLANARIRRKSAEKSLTSAIFVFGEIVEGKRPVRKGFDSESVERTLARLQAMPTLDERSAEEILGYVVTGGNK